MRPLPAVRALLPLLLLALTGCSDGGGGDADGDDGPDDVDACPDDGGETGAGGTASGSPGAGEDSGLGPEGDSAVFHVTFQSDCEATLEVPFPTLDSCRGPGDWMNGTVSGTAVAEVRDAGAGRTGKVLVIAGEGSMSWSSQIEAGPPCQTFRYDPWSTDPDPEGETVEVRVAAGEVEHAMVLTRLVRGPCGNATLYEGQPGADWTALPGRTAPIGC